MTAVENIKRYFQKLDNVRAQVRIVGDSSLLDIALLDNSILIVFASWSGPALSNFIQTIKLLDDKNYKGQIVIINIDDITPHLQVETFGDVCHGWSEIFFIDKGKVIERLLGATCFQNFKLKIDNLRSPFLKV